MRHPAIILFMGACIEPRAVVTEFAENGSVYDLIINRPDEMTSERAKSLTLDVARGMAYLVMSCRDLL